MLIRGEHTTDPKGAAIASGRAKPLQEFAFLKGARVSLIVVALLATHAALLAWQATCDSATWDEVGHFAAGLEHWRHGTFKLYTVNPPLVRLVALAPVAMVTSPSIDPMKYQGRTDPIDRFEFVSGSHLALELGPRYFRLLSVARYACIAFSVAGGYVCFLWSKELFGVVSGILALTLWGFSPTVLGYGHLITPDIGAAGLGVFAAYAFRGWIKSPSLSRTLGAGLAMGLAELTKTTWILLYGIWPAVWMLTIVSDRTGSARWGWGRQLGQLLSILILGTWVVNLGYGFDGSFRPLGKYHFYSEFFSGSPYDKTIGHAQGNRFSSTWFHAVPVPFPASFVGGIDVQKHDFESRLPSYLCGTWKRGGWWYYYLFALAIKEPIGTWAIALTAIILAVASPFYRVPIREELILLITGGAVFLFVSSQTGFNHHVRYVLPSFPFFFIWVSRVARSFNLNQRALAFFACAATFYSLSSSLKVLPHSLSYFNEIAGGPKNGHRFLGNSNSDWGQDLRYVGIWYDDHPEARPLSIITDMPLIPLGMVGIDRTSIYTSCRSDVSPRPAGWYIISVNQLHNESGVYQDFLNRKPVEWIGYTMPVYHITR